MSELRRARRAPVAVAALAALAATLAVAPGARAQPAGAGLREREAIALAADKSPRLRAALLQADRDRWDVRGEEARYTLVFLADGGFTRTAIPMLSGDGTAVNPSESVELGVGLHQRLVWGTDFQLRLGGSWELGHASDPLTGDALLVGPAYGLDLRFAVSQPLLRGFGRDVGEAGLVRAEASVAASERASDRVASELLQNVSGAYWELWYAERALGIERDSRTLSERERDEATARLDSGSGAPNDILPFETRVAQREEAVAVAELERARRRTALAAAAGLRPSAELGVPVDEPPVPDEPPADAVERAVAGSPAVREAEAALALAEVQARTADDPLRPRLDLEAYLEARGLGNRSVPPALAQFGKLGALSAHVGLVFELPVEDTTQRAAAAQAALGVEIARQKLEEARQSVAASVEADLERVRAARRRVELADRTSGLAERQLGAARDRFLAGDATPLHVLQAEEDLRAARLRAARARVDLVAASLSIDHATGRLLERYAARLRDASLASAATAARAGGEEPAPSDAAGD
ncbi:MAG: TolC family protein [Polyangiaceae bacterium]|nr:TolC family protein [Polyangiaceae bacterium]